MKKALCDKDPSVMACALNYFQIQAKTNPTAYKDLVNHFVIILKQRKTYFPQLKENHSISQCKMFI